MPFCENCGNKVSETAQFCSNCGAEVEKSVEHTLIKESKLKKYTNDKENVDINDSVSPGIKQPPEQAKKKSFIFFKVLLFVLVIWGGLSLINGLVTPIDFVDNINSTIFNTEESNYTNTSDYKTEYNGNVTDADGEFGEVLKRLTPAEIAFYRKVVSTYKPDPSNKLGKICGEGVATCKNCGNTFRYQMTFQSRVQELQKIAQNSEWYGLSMAYGQMLGKAFGADPIGEVAISIKEYLKDIRKNNIYSCAGEPPDFCPNCRN